MTLSRSLLPPQALVLGCALGVLGIVTSCGKNGTEGGAASVTAAPASVLAEIATWKSIGGVVDARQLASKSAAGRNAADLHRPLIGLMTALPPSDDGVLKFPWETPVSSLMYLLESYERELATTREALGVAQCNWGLPYEQGVDMEVPHLAYCRNIARLLVVEAIVRKEAGDFAAAADSLIDILRLSDQIATDGVAIVMAVRFSLDKMAIDGLNQLFYEEGLAEAKRVVEVLGNRQYRTDIRKALLGEGAMGIVLYRKAAGGDAAGPIEEQAMSAAAANELVWYLKMTRSFVEQANRPYYEMTALAESPRKPFGQVVEPQYTDPAQFDRMSRWAASAENYAAVARLATQLREHHEKHGEYPEPRGFRTPSDMLTGRPIGYDRFSDGFVLRFAHVDFEGNWTDAEWEW